MAQNHDPALRRVGTTLLVLAALLLVNSVAGPLVTGWVDYPISESMLNQLLGLEIITVLLVVPVTTIAGVLALRSRPLAPLLGLAPSAYAAYMFVQYVVGPEYATYSVTVVFHVAIASLAGILTFWCWSLAVRVRLPDASVTRRRRRAVWLAFLAGFVVLRYLPGLVGAATAERIPAEFLDSRSFYWSIFLLDLGIVVPVSVLAARCVVSATSTGMHAYYAVIGWFAMVPPSVAAMAVVMLVRDDPNASVATVVLLTVASLLFALPAVLAVRELAGRAAAPGADERGPRSPVTRAPSPFRTRRRANRLSA